MWMAFQEFVDEDNKEPELRKDFINRDHIIAPVEQFKIYKSLLKPFESKKIVQKTSESITPLPRKLGTKTDYVPPWYKGERGAYESAMRARSEITKLPPMKT